MLAEEIVWIGGGALQRGRFLARQAFATVASDGAKALATWRRRSATSWHGGVGLESSAAGGASWPGLGGSGLPSGPRLEAEGAVVDLWPCPAVAVSQE